MGDSLLQYLNNINSNNVECLYTVIKIYSEITEPELEVFMHKQSLKIARHLCWKFKVRVIKNNSDDRLIDAEV